MRHFLSILLLAASVPALGADPPVARFTENKGQWPEQVAFRTLVPGGVLFVERGAFTFTLRSGGAHLHHGHAENEPVAPAHAHAYRATFVGAGHAVPLGDKRLGHYENFFLGNDPSVWGTGCAVYGLVRMKGLYPGIDLEVDGREGLKYSFVVAPGGDPTQIVMRYEGQDRLHLEEGRLVVETTAGTMTEGGLAAYQQTDRGRKMVPCHFHLEGNLVSFALPDGHDPTLPLVIDPTLTFASYSGSTADNFGFTATYDNSGHLYGGGIVFGTGYPVTTGVLDPAFNGGTIDIGISKFSPDGTSLAWSTYLGGASNESPHSLVVNGNDELYVLGSTSSLDFPTTPGVHGPAFHGGTAISTSGPTGWAGINSGYGYGHPNGTDIIVAHFSADATSLVACTYVGGSGNDGLNNTLALAHNYGDHFRGEIALDAQGWPVVCTSTQSSDIPVSPNAPQPTFGGVQDAYIFRMDPGLSALQATFYGGSGADSGYGVQFDSSGRIYTTGGTTSGDLATPGTPLHPTMQGLTDGHVERWSGDLGQLLSATYLGTAEYDQSYFVQLDLDDQVYVVGQTHGAYPVSAGVYANPGSSQFIHKLDNGLSSTLWSTVIGSGSVHDVSPSAFLVSDCGQIYLSGWGGTVNNYAQGVSSTTVGLPVSADAFQPTTDGNDFYLLVLEQDAAALNYATFFGGPSSREHVDGGTSRFDKHGTVYQAVCAGCLGQDDFPTTPTAWSTTNGSFNCNLGVFKFDLIQPTAHVEVDGPSFACLPGATVSFLNLSSGGSIFEWDFGDGTDTVAFEPDHTYTAPGTYTVRLVLSSEDVCLSNDTAYTEVTILPLPTASIDPVPPACPGDSVQLNAHGGLSFQWLAAPGLAGSDAQTVMALPTGNTSYTVVVTNDCGSDSASVEVALVDLSGAGAGDDATGCQGQGVQLSATGGGSYAWTPAAGLDDPTSATPTASPDDTTLYTVLITTPEGCLVQDSVHVFVLDGPPVPVVGDTAICLGGQVQLHASGGTSYAWQAAPGIEDLGVADPWVSPDVPTTYVVVVGNACGTATATAFVDVQEVNASAWPDTTVCPGEPLVLHADGGSHYAWWPVSSGTDLLELDPAQAGLYTVVVSNDLGCQDTASLSVALYPPAWVSAAQESTIDRGQSAQLHAFGTGTLSWSPDSSLSCGTCPDPVASPEATTTYTVELTDGNGCLAFDQVTIYVRGNLFVPNTFTPNHDGINDRFRVLATELAEFRLMIFNRWGELIFSSERQEEGWDGRYGGHDSPVDTYVWRVDFRETTGQSRTLYGHVNLIR